MRKKVLLIVFSVVGIMILCTGYDTASYTSKVTGVRKYVQHVYIPFWSRDRVFTLYYHEKKFPSAVERFRQKHGFYDNDPSKRWNRDSGGPCYFWGSSSLVFPSAGRYWLINSFGYEDLLYEFLEEYEKSHPELAIEIDRFFQQPGTDDDYPRKLDDETIKWQWNLQLKYYRYLLDVNRKKMDQKKIDSLLREIERLSTLI